jgi:hypothetical protein
MKPLGWMFYRNWPEEHAVDKFFTALQQQDYETAYGIYFNDPGWRQHQQKYRSTHTPTFIAIGDRAASGDWSNPTRFTDRRTPNFGGGGVVVEVIVNERSEHARMFVQKSDKTLTVYPY